MTNRPSTTRSSRHGALLLLSACTVLIHGYHPLSEDGGIYVAGVQSSLNPALFPHDLAFVQATSRYSLFTPVMALITRSLHLPLDWTLLLAYAAGVWLFLYAALRLAETCFSSSHAQLSAVALTAAWFTLPVAGTSLLLMDPYVTARTFSTPLSMLALSFALAGRDPRDILRAGLCLLLAAAFHLLMATYALAFIAVLWIAHRATLRSRLTALVALAAGALAMAALLKAHAPPDTPAVLAASYSRYYWFLSQWQWFELLGLAGPLTIFAFFLRSSNPVIRTLSRSCLCLGSISLLVALAFAQQRFASHAVARLQPLRPFLLIYALLPVILGGSIASAPRAWVRKLAPVAMIAIACIFFFVQRQTYPASQHLELPGRAPTNPWSQAFVWARDHTPADALFAIDANYITTAEEDGQTFRATAQRSVLPDFSKDGGEAAVNSSLADAWFSGQQVQKDLSRLEPPDRYIRLHPLGVTWVVLRSTAKTNGVCPYANAVVKICPVASSSRLQ